jgi:hypothetical protein
MKKQIFLITCILALAACEKDIAPEPCQNPLDPNCVTYHPCNGQDPTSADFFIYEDPPVNGVPSWVKWKTYDTDTSYVSVSFFAKQAGASRYEWWIGTETQPRFGWKQSIRFPNERNTYRIRLIVHKTPNLTCNPADNGIDTVDRYFTRLLGGRDLHLRPDFGHHVGVSSEFPDSMLHISIFDTIPRPGDWFTAIKGINPCIVYGYGGTGGFRQTMSGGGIGSVVDFPDGTRSPSCNIQRIYVWCPPKTDSIYISYQRTNDQPMYHFKGRRIRPL